MRENRDAQASIFDFYSKHEKAQQLRNLCELLDRRPVFLHLLEQDFQSSDVKNTGARGLKSGEYSALASTQANAWY